MVVSRRWWGLTLAAVIVSGCTEVTSSADPTTSIPPTEIPGSTPSAVANTAGPEPTGVPGLTASDPLCAAWAGYVGTVQALGVATSFGDLSSAQIAALELASAPYLVEVAAGVDQAWPVELQPERSVVIEQRIGPFARRAGRAVDALVAGGVTRAELAALKSAWESALATRDPQLPVLAVPNSSVETQAKVDAAAIAFDSAVTPFAQDPSLVVDAIRAPLTGAYLAAHCPDLAASGVGDAL
ncbi:MAG: hypothetical protein QOE09_1167 [Ilumatobacteraceae bacterium]|jgi:hypothetical protein